MKQLTMMLLRGLLGMLLLAAAICVTSDAVAQTYCTTGSTPPAPPGPSEPPSFCGLRACPFCTGSPCYVASGVYVNQFADLSMRTVGFPLIAARTYDSSRAVDGPQGIGWLSSLVPHLYVATYFFSAPSTYTRQIEYVTAEGYVYVFSVAASGNCTPPTGRYDKLVQNADGTFDLTPQFTLSQYHFNVDGSIAKMTDDFGNVLAFTYDTNGHCTRVADQAGSTRGLDITWGMDGRIATVTDNTIMGSARSVQYSYGTDGTLASVTDTMAHTTSLSYTAGRFGPLLASVRDHWSRLITALAWDSIGRLQSYTEGDPAHGGETYTYAYSPNTSSTTKTDSLGTKIFSYASGALITTDGRSYDANGNVLSDINGAYQYDNAGHVTTATIGNVSWTYTYDTDFPDKVASTVASPNNWPTLSYEYAPLTSSCPGMLTAVKQKRSDGSATDMIASYTCGSHGVLTAASSVSAGNTNYTYNTAGDRTVVAGETTIAYYGYDALGRVTSVADGASHTTSFTYDNADRLLLMTLPPPATTSTLLFRTSHSYDTFDVSTGLLFDITVDPNGHTTKTGYDAVGNLVQSIDALGKVTGYNYVHGLLTSLTDANGNVTSYTYSSDRSLLKTTFPDGRSETYSYDSNGRLTSITDRHGLLTTYTYDPFGRLTQKTAGTTYLSVGYDGASLSSVTYNNGTASDALIYTYDPAYRRLTELQVGRAMITYTYPPNGGASPFYSSYSLQPLNLNPSVVPRQSNYTGDITRIDSIQHSLIAGTFSFTYNNRGNYDTITSPNGQTRHFSYDDQDRLVTIENRHPTKGLLASYTYGYDHDWPANTDTLLGQRTSVTVDGAAGANLFFGTTTYRYDADYQLIGAAYPDGSSESWTYDDIGNRIASTYSSGGYTTTISYSYVLNSSQKNSNRLTAKAPNLVYSYDDYGNVSNHGGYHVLAYDWNNQMISATSSSSTTTYAFDGAGRRFSAATGAQQTFYLYEGLNPVIERTPQTLAWNDYVFGPGIDEPLALLAQGTDIRYFSADGLGSVVAKNDVSGNLLDSAGWMAWGGTGPSLFGYTSREMSDSGLVYYRARNYDPSLGRFLSEDPLGIDKVSALEFETQPSRRNGVSRLVNLYAYANNNPTNVTDPSGLIGCNANQIQTCMNGCNQRGQNYKDCTIHELPCGLFTVRWTYCECHPKNNNCPPCPTVPPKPPEYHHVPNQHGCPSGHWHYYIWNQNPGTCQCYPQRLLGGCLP